MFRSRNDAVRTAPATLGDADNAGRKRSAIRSALTLTAVAVGITAGSVLGVSPANAVTRASGPAPEVGTRTVGDCTLSAKLLVERHDAGKLGTSFSSQGVGDVRCLTSKSIIKAELLLNRNGQTVLSTSGSWTDTRSLGGESMWTTVYQGGTLSGCGQFQSLLNVYIGGAAPVSVASGAPVNGCAA